MASRSVSTAPRAATRVPGPRLPPPRTRLAREQRVDDILAAARDVFSEYGYQDAAVADIADRCGVVEGTVYKYFESKRALLVSMLCHWYEELFGDYRRELPGLNGARQKLRYLVWRHLRSIRDNPALARLMFQQVRMQPDYRGSQLYAMNRRYCTMLTDVVREGIAAGQISADRSPAMVRDLVYGGIEHLTWAFVAGYGKLDVDRQADALLALLWNGLAVCESQAASSSAPPALDAQVRRLTEVAERLEKASRTAKTSRR